MCSSCRSQAGAFHRPTGCNSSRSPFAASSQQWQALESPGNQNRALRATQTQTCHHQHTQRQRQNLSHMVPPPCDTIVYDANNFCQPHNSLSSCSGQQRQQRDCGGRQSFEALLHNLLDYAIRNFDTSQDCSTCRTLVLQPSQQSCTICTTDPQQLVFLLLNLIEGNNTTTTQTNIHSCRHSHRTQSSYCSNSCSPSTSFVGGNQYFRTMCTCQAQCSTCTTTHEQTKTLFDVLFRMTRHQSSYRCQHRNVQVSSSSQQCSHSRTAITTNDNDLCRLVRQILEEIEGEGNNFCSCRTPGCQVYVGGNVRRLKKVIREIERSCEDCHVEDGGCRCSAGSYEMSRTTTTYEEPERRRPRVGNFHVGWML